jgi:tetratricopeptide (TPR) repeat protein
VVAVGIAKNIFAVLVPGGGKMSRRKYLSAAAVLVLWTASLDAYILLKTLKPAGIPLYVEPALLTMLVATFVANLVNELLHIGRERRNISTGRVDELYGQALSAYVSGEDHKADDLLKSALQLDELNADCLFFRGQVAAQLGKKRRARRLLRKCRDFDENDKWKWEIASILGQL